MSTWLSSASKKLRRIYLDTRARTIYHIPNHGNRGEVEMNDELIAELAEFSKDPLGFVHFAFPWGEPGTELEKEDGPDEWQTIFLASLREGLITVDEAIQLARTSGHGVGKSALVSWIILWSMSTFEDTRGVVTANTENQLKTKTWVECAKWFRLFIGRDMFKFTATAIFARDPEHSTTWRFDMVPWSERNTEAFAGLHNYGKRIVVIFDEASAIPDIIWETTEGALTDEDTEIIWCVFGNPTQNVGRFRECFPGGRFAHRWNSAAIDSRTSKRTDKKQIQRWIDDYGEDHDFVRVRVRGVFPRVDATSFISLEVAREASLREVQPQTGFPVVLGVDVGRFGDDPAVIYPRCGRDARSREIELYYTIDTMELATKIVQAYHKHNATFVFVDGGGVGGGVVDRLRQLRIPVMEIQFGAKPDGTSEELDAGTKYKNKRAEIWGAMRAWLPTGAIPDKIPGAETGLVDELVGPHYGMDNQEAIQLESKKEMKRRGVPSPNVADALACTFAFPTFKPRPGMKDDEHLKPRVEPDWDPYSSERMAA